MCTVRYHHVYIVHWYTTNLYDVRRVERAARARVVRVYAPYLGVFKAHDTFSPLKLKARPREIDACFFHWWCERLLKQTSFKAQDSADERPAVREGCGSLRRHRAADGKAGGGVPSGDEADGGELSGSLQGLHAHRHGVASVVQGGSVSVHDRN